MAVKTNSTPNVKRSAEAYELVLEKLVSWQYQPGHILIEAQLAAELGMSRTPVREALRALVAEGFLRVVPRSGYMVLPLRPEDVREIYHMRLLLEGEAVALAAQRLNEAEVQGFIEKWKSRLKEMDLPIQEAGEPRPLTPDDNTPFHLAVARASGSGRLVEAIDKLLQDSFRVMSYYRSTASLFMLAKEHMSILDAICTGDPDQARAAMRQHIEQGWTGFDRWFREPHGSIP